MESTIIQLIGAPGTGKYTIGREVARRTGARLVDNHSVANVILNLLAPDGVTPLPSAVWPYVAQVRGAVYDALANLAPAELSYVFTNVLRGDDPVPLAPDLLAIPVPGHTAGSAALLFRDEVLFTGDHLWGDGPTLDASRDVCWHSWSEQIRSVERLLAHRFSAVCPGHEPVWRGRPEDARRELRSCLARMRLAAA